MFEMCGYDWGTKTALKSDHPLAGGGYLSFARKLRRVGEDNGMVCNQSHAPFPSSCREIRSYFQRAIECTAEAGGQICIIHLDNDQSPEENADMYRELLPFAKGCGVKIATENMWNWNAGKGLLLLRRLRHAGELLRAFAGRERRCLRRVPRYRSCRNEGIRYVGRPDDSGFGR